LNSDDILGFIEISVFLRKILEKQELIGLFITK